MVMIEGFIASSVDDLGNSDVIRMSYADREQTLYSIDSERVVDLYVFQRGEIIRPDSRIVGGKTLPKFSTTPNRLFGITYRRELYAQPSNGIYEFRDYWEMTRTIVFILALPRHAVIRELTSPDGLDEYDLDGHLIMSGYCREQLQIDLKYQKDSVEYASTKLPPLERSSLPYEEVDMVLRRYEWDFGSVSNIFSKLSIQLDWLSRGYVLYQILERLGLL